MIYKATLYKPRITSSKTWPKLRLSYLALPKEKQEHEDPTLGLKNDAPKNQKPSLPRSDLRRLDPKRSAKPRCAKTDPATFREVLHIAKRVESSTLSKHAPLGSRKRNESQAIVTWSLKGFCLFQLGIWHSCLRQTYLKTPCCCFNSHFDLTLLLFQLAVWVEKHFVFPGVWCLFLLIQVRSIIFGLSFFKATVKAKSRWDRCRTTTIGAVPLAPRRPGLVWSGLR